ncbi:hypothetical protein [Lewinella sp. JB7]|uniref:hypothetical protein n=1 Tax=Lewinella sp. JB7 TaxID=2962887 RepID=UPI0020C95334|nr:hypothetical protein [Lewinella sp. JB7]MCP9237604.1 hypothetical protein [Lewinella sp. JB7]
MYRLALLLLVLCACSDGPPTTPETRPVENPNAGNTAIYDVDADDPYEIGDGAFLDMRPGAPVATFRKLLKEDGGRYNIRGRRRDRLGYVLTDASGETIASIHVTSPDVVTQNGIRVGLTQDELRERIGPITPGAPGPDGLRCVTQDALTYCLQGPADGTPATIVEIVLQP